MPKQIVFVVSALGQDIFWDGASGITTDIYAAQTYANFANAEAAAVVASQGDLGLQVGSLGIEIRTIVFTT